VESESFHSPSSQNILFFCSEVVFWKMPFLFFHSHVRNICVIVNFFHILNAWLSSFWEMNSSLYGSFCIFIVPRSLSDMSGHGWNVKPTFRGIKVVTFKRFKEKVWLTKTTWLVTINGLNLIVYKFWCSLSCSVVIHSWVLKHSDGWG